jgi:putative transposase
LSQRSQIAVRQLLAWAQIAPSSYFGWQARYGQPNQHNGTQPRQHWLTPAEREAILAWQREHPLEGYRRLSYMLLDADVVAASPSTVYRVLRDAGCLARPPHSASGRKGSGFEPPTHAHEHWHIDISYLNVCGTFYYLCLILDGFSRAVIEWDIRSAMPENAVELLLQRARERYPQAAPRLISDNGPQFIARDFKAFVRWVGMTHVRTSPHYPQSNGKLERFFRSLKESAIRPNTPLSLPHAVAVVAAFVAYYNGERLHSAIGYITPNDMLADRADLIFEQRHIKLDAARRTRQHPVTATVA